MEKADLVKILEEKIKKGEDLIESHKGLSIYSIIDTMYRWERLIKEMLNCYLPNYSFEDLNMTDIEDMYNWEDGDFDEYILPKMQRNLTVLRSILDCVPYFDIEDEEEED